MAVPAELEDPVAEEPEPVLVAEAPDLPLPEPDVAVAAGVTVPLTPMLARSVYNDADVNVTQLLDAAGVGVYGTPVIDTVSAGWVQVVVTPLVTYTPTGVISAPWQASKVPFLALFGALKAQPIRS